MRFRLTRLLFVATTLIAAAVVLPQEAGAQRKFSFAYDQPHTTAYGIAADIFQAKLKELLPHVERRHVDEREQIGRNDPCWCGSGKKFKKCHGAA